MAVNAAGNQLTASKYTGSLYIDAENQVARADLISNLVTLRLYTNLTSGDLSASILLGKA